MMRITQFNELVFNEFGNSGASMLIDHVLLEFKGSTGKQALEDGVNPREVWLALCRDFGVPPERW